MLCGSCNTSYNIGTSCGYCKKHYCFSCSKISEDDYVNMRPYLRAAWKCLPCRVKMDAPPPYQSVTPLPYQSVTPLPTAPTLNDINSVDIISKLNEISSKLECLPKLVADVAIIKSQLGELRKTCGLSKPTTAQSYVNKASNKASSSNVRDQSTGHSSSSQVSSSGNEPDKIKQMEHKSQDPFALAPASRFDLDEFKRYYSHNEADAAILWFWEQFDPEHYSVWYAEYKRPHELTKLFMSCNLITGMFQRLERLRKHAFASVCVFGEDNNSSISGVWVWKGHDLVFTQSPDWQDDYEFYEWRRLELVSKDTMRLVQQYLSRRGADAKGRPLHQAKIFK